MGYLLGEAEGNGNFQLHFRPVVRVPAPALRLPIHGHGESIVPHQLLDILLDAVRVAEFFLLKFSAHLIAEAEGDALVYHCLAAQHIPVVFHGDVDIREHLLVRLPVEHGAGLLAVSRLLFQAADISAPLKVQVVAAAIPADGGIEELRGVLGGTGAEAVEAQGILIVLPILAIFAAGVHLAENQLPVVAFFLFVVIHRAAPSKVLYLHAQVLVAGDDDGVAVALPRLVDGVGEDLKHRMLAALQVIGAKNNGRALTHPILPLQHGDAGIAVLFLLFCCHNSLPAIVIHFIVVIISAFLPKVNLCADLGRNRDFALSFGE